MTRDSAGSVSNRPSSARLPAGSTKCTCCSIGSIDRLVAGDIDPHRVAQQRLGQLADLRRHGGGEQRRLPVGRQGGDDAADVADEAEIEHAVRLVEHEVADLVQLQFAGGHQVADAAGRADHDVGAAAHPLHLRRTADAAEDRDDAALMLAAEAMQAFLDLQGELAGRRQDECARGVAVRPPPGCLPGAAASAARKRRSCRCRSARRRADRGRRAAEGWHLPGWVSVDGSALGRERAARARPSRVSQR